VAKRSVSAKTKVKAKTVAKVVKAAKAVQKDSAKELAIQAARIAEQSNCEEVVVLDLRELSPVTDYFVIATGASGRQMRSTAEDVMAFGKSIEQKVWHHAGLDGSDWIVLDFVDVVVHLFDAAHRQYYDLEMMWGDCPRVTWKKRAVAKKKKTAKKSKE
jgi:ribosome-associated protein